VSVDILLEKDIWVVWALQILGTDQQLLQSLTFKGGTSLSKAHGLIDRFSEDVDYSRLWHDLDRLARAGIAEAAVRDRTLAADSALFGPARGACQRHPDRQKRLLATQRV
jgi:hypothetical protein